MRVNGNLFGRVDLDAPGTRKIKLPLTLNLWVYAKILMGPLVPQAKADQFNFTDERRLLALGGLF